MEPFIQPFIVNNETKAIACNAEAILDPTSCAYLELSQIIH